jgi:hypothetical protein
MVGGSVALRLVRRIVPTIASESVGHSAALHIDPRVSVSYGFAANVPS